MIPRFPIGLHQAKLPALLLLLLLLASCAEQEADGLVSRETLPGGGTVLTYASTADQSEDTISARVRIGSLEGGGPDTFGSIKGIEATPDGAIYVLDSQSSEIKVFEADGSFRATLTREGEGPGELAAANGIAFAPDGTLWVNDHGNGIVKQLSPDGGEIGRTSRTVDSFMALWNGFVDANGLLWERTAHGDEASPEVIETGPMEAGIDWYYKSFDPRTQAYDSIHVGKMVQRTYQAEYRGFPMYAPIPFSAVPLATMDRSGRIWTASSDSYVLTATDASGDTLVVVRKEEAPLPVASSDIEAWKTEMAVLYERFPVVMAAVDGLIPERKPLLTRLFVDDENRLWVGRTVADGEAPLFDVYESGGDFLGSVRLFAGMSPYIVPQIRNGRVYALVHGELDEQYVVAGDLPDF